MKILGAQEKGMNEILEDVPLSFLLAMKGVSGHFHLCLQGDHLMYYGEHHLPKVGDVVVSGKT
jgi:hypothetical protein